MFFKSFTELVNKINSDLGPFCNEFQYKRKELTGKQKIAGNGKLFGNIKEGAGWAINKGSGTEVQYHIVFDKDDMIVYYGIGFNTQYTRFSNDMSMVEYARPFMNAFLQLEDEISKELNDYSYQYNDRNSLVNPQEGKYTLFGKKIEVTENSNDEFEIDDPLYQILLSDLKKQFGPYIQIFELRNKLKKMNKNLTSIHQITEYKKQVIFQGPPGSGKTYTAKDIAEEIIFGELSADKTIQKNNLELSDQFKLIQFHPSYTYEDFVRGIIANVNASGQVEYKVENKILAKFAQIALDNDSNKYVLIIDEINRANLPSVLGELIYALEYRGESVDSMYDIDGDRKIILPPNLYIIGTMNTADRSVGHIDYAIRRRFAFVDILPSSEVIEKVITDPILKEKAKKLYAEVSSLFYEKKDEKDITTIFLAADFKAHEVQLGHSYFLAETEEQLRLKLEYEIKPLLKEYIKDGLLLNAAEQKIIELHV